MMFLTHLAFAALLWALAVKFFYLSSFQSILLFFLLALGALLPDIDHGGSLIGKNFSALGIFFRHRGIIHSLVFGVALTIIIYLVLAALGISNTLYAFGFLAGYISHLLLDALTKGGIMLFWPGRIKIRNRFSTGSFLDWLIAAVFICAFIILLI